MKKRIDLEQVELGIVASFYIDDLPDPRIVELFGTHTLPTPYTSMAAVSRAVAEIALRNPGYTINVLNR